MEISKSNGINAETSSPARKALRFNIPGATVRLEGAIAGCTEQNPSGVPCPIIDVSRGGVSFLTDFLPKLNRIMIALVYSEQEEPIPLEGRVVYAMPRSTRMSHRYRVGVEFFPFSHHKGHNSLEALRRLEKLEAIYGADDGDTSPAEMEV